MKPLQCNSDRPGWVFTDPTWWCTQLLRCTKALRRGTILANFDSGTDWEGIIASYPLVLRFLNEESGPLGLPECKGLLAVAKCLRKWELADASKSSIRRNEALDGFLQRNKIAEAQALVPEPFRSRMRELLRSWLPPLNEGEDGRILGKFGNGNVFEHYGPAAKASLLTQGPAQVWTDPFWSPDRQVDLDLFLHTDLHRARRDPVRGSVFGRTEARLSAVAKEYRKDRLITVEPVINSFRQQLCRRVIYESIHAGPLRGTAMDALYNEGDVMQQRLAEIASYNGCLGTIDITNGSDNITWDQVQDLFPEWVVRMLSFCRSDVVVDPRTKERHQTYIYAGMGNATTFVVETLFFSALTCAVSWAIGSRRSEWLRRVNVSTYGDDVITTPEVCQALSDLCISCMPLNLDKSFWKGDFRESCGAFCLRGERIDVPRINGYRNTPEGRMGLADLIRSLAEDWGLFQPLIEAIMAYKPVPNYWFKVEGACCVSIPWIPESELPKLRWNTNYQRVEAQCRTPEAKVINIPCFEEVGYPRREAEAQLQMSLLLQGDSSPERSCLTEATSRQTVRKGRPYVKEPIKDKVIWRNRWLPIVLP